MRKPYFHPPSVLAKEDGKDLLVFKGDWTRDVPRSLRQSVVQDLRRQRPMFNPPQWDLTRIQALDEWGENALLTEVRNLDRLGLGVSLSLPQEGFDSLAVALGEFKRAVVSCIETMEKAFEGLEEDDQTGDRTMKELPLPEGLTFDALPLSYAEPLDDDTELVTRPKVKLFGYYHGPTKTRPPLTKRKLDIEL